MEPIVEGLMKQLISGDNLALMSNKVGADDKSVKSTLEMGLPLLLGAMNNNASKPEGINAIMNGMAQMGNNNPMDNMSSYLGAPDSFQGSDMLSSMLGSNLQPIQQSISKSTGLPLSVVGQILSMVLPLVIGSLSKSSSKQNLAPEDLSKFLGEQSEMAISTSPDAAGVMKGLFASQQSGGGLMGMIKKFLKF